MTKPTLLVLAAGMGSRYGSLKQMDAFGPNGETIIDYSLYDAIEAGFGKVVFIIRESFKPAFKKAFDKYNDKIEVQYVTQELSNLPDGYTVPEGREKPWGTAHAVWVAKDEIHEPFGVINADDYYGKSAYLALAEFLNTAQTSGANDFAVIGYYLNNTLSDHGSVNRGVCSQDRHGHLESIVECIKIEKVDGENYAQYPNEKGEMVRLPLDTLVSMNMFGFLPSYFDHAGKQFVDFLNAHGKELKSEFFIPLVLDTLIQQRTLNVKVIDTDATWFGVTYQEDKPVVQQKIKDLIDQGVYPAKLW